MIDPALCLQLLEQRCSGCEFALTRVTDFETCLDTNLPVYIGVFVEALLAAVRNHITVQEESHH